MDLSKASDSVKHNMLLTKLSKIGIKGVPLKFFKSYLTNIKQCVEISHTTKNTKITSQSDFLSNKWPLVYHSVLF